MAARTLDQKETLMFMRHLFTAAAALIGIASSTGVAHAQPGAQADCSALPSHGTLKAALDKATAEEKSGLNNHMWATVVNRDGVVCAVAFSGSNRASQWPGSRVISAQKANTANAFGLDSTSNSAGSGQASGLALSTANLYAPVQPGASLFGLQFSNPVNTDAAYAGPYASYGTAKDPMVGNRVAGVNVFGGGLGLYAAGKRMVG